MEKNRTRAVEIERKYLVKGKPWEGHEGIPYRQGYVSLWGGTSVRARVAGEKGFLTIKGRRTGISRIEFEYPIPASEASEIIDTLCEGRVVEKTRYRIEYDGLIWEIDRFHGRNEGLVVAEVELESEDQVVSIPEWAGEEVTEDGAYSSSKLSRYPYSTW